MNPKLRRMGRFVTAAVISVAVCGAFGADWTVPLGTPEEDRTVSASVTYDNITTSEKIIIRNGAKLATKQSDAVFFTVAADAVAGEDGYVDCARIEAGSTLAPDKFQNNNANPARIVFAGKDATIADDRTAWYLTMFTKGPVVLQDETGDGIRIGQLTPTDYAATGHGINAADVSVRFLGAGDVTFAWRYGWASGRQPWTINRGLSIETTSAVIFSCNYGGQYTINGDAVLADSVTGVTVQGAPNNTAEDAACYLQVNSGYTLRAKNLTANLATRGRVRGSGTIEMGADDSDGTFDALVRGNTLTLRKIGAGALTVGASVTNIPSLNVAGGSVQCTTSFSVGTATIAEGASLVVDRALVTVGTIDAASLNRIVGLNGGRVVVKKAIPAGGKVELRDAVPDNAGVEYVTEGVGTAVIFGGTCPSAALHAKGGVVKFSSYGLTDRFLRLTFKRTWGWLNYSGVRQAPDYLRLIEFAFYDPDGTRIFSDPSNVYDVSAVATGSKKPEELTGLCAMAQEGTVFSSTGGDTHKSLTGLFNHTFLGWYPYFQTVKLDDTAFADGKFERFYFHSRTSDPVIHGYNIASPVGAALPRTWTIEASPDGTDGSWYVVSDAVDYKNGFLRDEGWLNGVRYEGAGTADQGLCMVFTNYVSAGVSPNVRAVSVEVEDGATIDFANVTDGQPVNRIAYDLTTGGGVINAAKLAPEGVFELSAKPTKNEGLQLRLTNVTDGENIGNWVVKAGGVTLRKQLQIGADGTVEFVRKGMMLIFR